MYIFPKITHLLFHLLQIQFKFRIQNYVCLLKDFNDLNFTGIIINETVTSRHDTCRISEMFHLLQSNYEAKFGNSLKFRIIGMDLSWATIHAALKVVNFENVEEYANRIFEYSSSQEEEFSKSFLSSCCSHTMHRFTRALKRQVFFLEKEHCTFAIFCFSLLLNCIDLESSKEIFRLMCIVFLNSKFTRSGKS